MRNSLGKRRNSLTLKISVDSPTNVATHAEKKIEPLDINKKEEIKSESDMFSPSTPFSQILDNIYISDFKLSADYHKLKALGITNIINCAASKIPNSFPNEFSYFSLKLRDIPGCELTFAFYSFIQYVEDTLQKEKPSTKILVHCCQGVSRAPTMLAGYLIWKYNLTMREAYSMMKEKRPGLNINLGFAYQLQKWAEFREVALNNDKRFYLLHKETGKLECDRIEVIGKKICMRNLFKKTMKINHSKEISTLNESYDDNTDELEKMKITPDKEDEEEEDGEFVLLVQLKNMFVLCGKDSGINSEDKFIQKMLHLIKLLQILEKAPGIVVYIDDNCTQKYSILDKIIKGIEKLDIKAE